MKTIEILSLIVMAILGIYASASDISSGIIKNKAIKIGAIYAIIADSIYYGVIIPAFAKAFFLNLIILTIISLILFFSHSWAGGDCKLLCLFGMLYPARFYIGYYESRITLPLTVMIAFMLGYLYLIETYIHGAIHERKVPSLVKIKISLMQFVYRYVRIIIYISALHLFFQMIVSSGRQLNNLWWITIGFCVAWMVDSIPALKNKTVIGIVLVLDAVLSAVLGVVPISTHIAPYLFLILVVIVKDIVSEQNYKIIPTQQVCAGMILSTATTMLFIRSRVKGLPDISTEDLKSRLSAEEAESVKRWEKSVTGKHEIVIVRKIPFAIFIFLSFVIYFAFWSVI